MSEELEQEIESGVDTEASPEPEKSEQEPAAAKQAGESKEEKSEESDPDKQPFHKHPRWIERDNELKQERQARQSLEQQYREMQSKLDQLSAPKGPDKRAAMIEKLKGIDPDFADFVSGLAPSKELEDLRRWKADSEAQNQRQQAYSQIDKLHDQYKVDAKMRDRYKRDIEFAVQANPNLQLSDLPQVYKKVHDEYTQWTDEIKRAERATYTAAKKESAKAPASQTSKGAPVKPGKSKDSEWTGNRDLDREHMIKKIVSQAKANQDI